MTPRVFKLAADTFKNNSTTFLSGAAIAGVVGTAILAIRATPGAVRTIQSARDRKLFHSMSEEERESDGVHVLPDLTIVETVKETWRIYLPTAVAGVATIACIAGANAIGLRRNAAMLGAYTLVDGAFREYKDKVIEQIGEAKERKVQDAVAIEQMTKNPPVSSQVIFSGKGETLFYDSLTGRYFKSDQETIRQAENEINRRILTSDMWASLNDFYSLVGLPHTELGDEMGFNVDHMVNLVFTAHLAEGGEPSICVGFRFLPVVDFAKSY
jgi:Family of unknown function (DUF6353)